MSCALSILLPVVFPFLCLSLISISQQPAMTANGSCTAYIFNRVHASSRRPLEQYFAMSAYRTSITDLAHVDSTGRPAMADVAERPVGNRTATASGRIYIPPTEYQLIAASFRTTSNHSKMHTLNLKEKLDAKEMRLPLLSSPQSWRARRPLIPLSYPLPLADISVTFTPELPGARNSTESSVGCNKLT